MQNTFNWLKLAMDCLELDPFPYNPGYGEYYLAFKSENIPAAIQSLKDLLGKNFFLPLYEQEGSIVFFYNTDECDWDCPFF